jgi:hypothetical protein
VKRECYSLNRWKGQTEKAPRVGRGRPAKLVWIVGANFGDLAESVRDPRWLVPFPAEWHRREIRRIGLDQKAIARHQANQIVVSPLLERHDTAERDVPTGGDSEFRQGCRTSVAVQNSYDSGVACLADHRSRVVLGITGVDDHRAARLLRERNLRSKSSALRIAWRIVVVVVETALTHRDRTALNKAAQLGDVPLGVECRGVVGMNARRRENEARAFRGVLSCDRCYIDGLADAHDRDRARFAGARDYRVAVAGERCVREVGVAVDEACRAPVLRGHLRSIQRRTGAAT